MKKTFNIILVSCLALLFVACADDNQVARTPLASVTVSATDLEINQSMEIRFNGIADQVVVYPGDDGHVYALKDSSNTGFVVNKGMLTYAYSVPGTFHVVCVASTYDTFMAGGLASDTIGFNVKVIDDVTTIDKIYSSITPNTYYANLVDDSNWMMSLPVKQVYNSKEIAISQSRQRLNFEIGSDSSKIYVDDVLYSAKTYYDLTKTHVIKVTSNYGSVRNYNLYTMVYPEFSSVSIAGVSGTLTRSAYEQDLLTYTFTLPSGTDVSSVVPTFAVDDKVKFYADGKEIVSGVSTIDLTDADAVYTMERTSVDNDNIKISSRVRFVINNN